MTSGRMVMRVVTLPTPASVLVVCLAGVAACSAEEAPAAGTPDVPGLGAAAGPAAGLAPLGGAPGTAGVAASPGVAPAAGSQDVATAGTSGAAASAAEPVAGMMAGDGSLDPTAGVMAGAAAGEPAAGVSGDAAAGGAAGMAGVETPDPPAAGDVCERWTAVHGDLVEGSWTGNAATCDPGDMSEETRESALRLVNFYRSLAGLAAVEMSDENNRLAQACALMMQANGRISHTPSASWQCYTMEAADTAASSSLSNGPALGSVDGYMVDPGNPTTLGHRRWILSNLLSGIGFGSTGNFSCQYQPAAWRPGGGGGAPWTAWPPPGQVPIQALGTSFFGIDRTGWSVQSDSIDFGGAQVAVTADGMDLPVTVTPLLPGYGSSSALSILPVGWATEAGKSYHVSISGGSAPVEYDVQVVSCP